MQRCRSSNASRDYGMWRRDVSALSETERTSLIITIEHASGI
jgi:hypothetical protein